MGAIRNIQSICMDEVLHDYEKVKQIDSMCDNALAGDWQPIETAPKDGYHIQLWRPDIQFVGYYAKAGWCANGPVLLDPPPTHWKPLPDPPEDV